MRARSLAACFLWLAAAAGLSAEHAPAEPSGLFNGKTITIVVGYGPGGGYDTYSRLMAKHMVDHLPGRPSIIVQNMPGAGSLEATNYVYAKAAKDGTVIAAVNQNMPAYQLLDSPGVYYDARRFVWLGSAVASNSVIYTWKGSNIATLQDAKTKTVLLGTTDVSGMAAPRIMDALLGLKFKLLPGYRGTGEINLAMERGEIAGSGGTTWAGLTLSGRELLAKHLINLLIQTGPAKEMDLPDVPLFSDLAKPGQDRQIAELASLSNAIGYAFWMSPDAPAGRVAALKTAYADTMRDPKFLSDAAKAHLIVRPQSAEVISNRVRSAFETPKEAIARLKKILAN